jgi:hypothetical protein
VALAGSFVASALALVRYALKENRAISERFTTYLEGALSRQEEINRKFQVALDNLVENVRDNSALLNRVVERLP